MKKFAILALAALLVVALTVPAAALENEFGGYWRTRFYQEGHFDGESDDAGNYRLVDTRTRLYYTAKINDNLKLVNKFEMDATWGEHSSSFDVVDTDGDTQSISNSRFLYGDLGADGVAIEIKNTYADFNLGPVNFTVGVQPYVLWRSFYIDDDDAGMIARWPIGEGFGLAASWLKAWEGGPGDGNNEDLDSYTLTGWVYFSENIALKPSINWVHSTDTSDYLGVPAGTTDRFTFGVDFDMNYDAFGLWFTGFLQAGSTEDVQLSATVNRDQDYKGYLAAIGGNVMLGPVDLHGQAFYASGDDDPLDGDVESVSAPRASYYWSEIMGYGIFDRDVSAGSPGDKISNIWAANLGTTFKPMDKLSTSVDLWYARLVEDDAFGEDYLGTELDVVVTYQLVEGLNLDLVGAYLWAGDATSTDGNNDENPYEFGARLSLSF